MFILPYDLAPVREAAVAVGARVVYDGAHPLGLIAGGAWPNPLREGADVLTGSTQKSLFGPIGGLILTASDELGARVFDVGTKLISNYENNRVLALGVALAELAAFGPAYAAACVANAQALARASAALDFEPLGASRGFTRSNQVLLRVAPPASADALVERWERANIVATAMALPRSADDPRPVAGIRLGVQELTRLGMGPGEMRQVAELLRQATDTSDAEVVAAAVAELVGAFPTVAYCFEQPAPAG